MFIHGKTNKKYYSVREKIKFYNDILSGKRTGTVKQKKVAKNRLKSLNRINNQSYTEPTLIITSDKHFGNPIHKPRVCVALGVDDKDHVIITPILKRESKTIILDKIVDREVRNRKYAIDKSEVYETKYINNLQSLTKYDKNKINKIIK